ncbi:MAG: hypothetical protein QNJ12_02400 [Ilumatobacter sp.]|uniref:peroxiredoxin family protein n=1 Tax=Ilumatobacter sp. TaxID=1967498 RepID=UPI0026390147|nr:hypothetical protein [Ilumatobacter sp.]MDJ0767608.1 hypothetical protein [Ilumatobacter sp.]
MRLGAESDRIHAAGAEVIAISVDDEQRQAGMFERWPTPNVLYVSDPGGERYLLPLGLFDPEERGGIGRPGMIVLAPDGAEVYRYDGRDFADRTTDAEVYAALDGLDLDPIEPPPGGPFGEVPGDLRGFFRPDHLVPYFKGNRFGAVAIAGRTEDRTFRAIAREHRVMADETLAAWDRVRAR